MCANAGIAASSSLLWETEESAWQDMIDVNLTGVWHTIKSAIPSMIAADKGGSIIITGSAAGSRGYAHIGHYVTAKHGLIGLMRTLCLELADYNIRVNLVSPTNVSTEMLLNESTYRILRPDLSSPNLEDTIATFQSLNALPTPYVDVSDVSSAVLWLASAASRFVTGIVLPVDAGSLVK